MRTTINIDDHLLAEAKIVAARTSRSLGAVVDDALRALLTRDPLMSDAPKWTFPTSGDGGVRAGVDLEDKESLADLLGDNALP